MSDPAVLNSAKTAKPAICTEDKPNDPQLPFSSPVMRCVTMLMTICAIPGVLASSKTFTHNVHNMVCMLLTSYSHDKALTKRPPTLLRTMSYDEKARNARGSNNPSVVVEDIGDVSFVSVVDIGFVSVLLSL